MEKKFPVIETGPLPEYFCDGIYRIDRVGSQVHVYYFQWAKDPHINGGELYRLPILKHIRPRDTLTATAGVMKDWLGRGVPPPLVLPPSLGGKVY